MMSLHIDGVGVCGESDPTMGLASSKCGKTVSPHSPPELNVAMPAAKEACTSSTEAEAGLNCQGKESDPDFRF